MTTVHHYEIAIRQGDLVIDLGSDDVRFISQQMNNWFGMLLPEYELPSALPVSMQEPVLLEPVAAPEPESLVPELKLTPVAASPVAAPAAVEVAVSPATLPASPPPILEAQPKTQPTDLAEIPPPEETPVSDTSQPVADGVMVPAEPEPEPDVPPTDAADTPEAPDADFERVMDTLMEDLDAPDELNLTAEVSMSPPPTATPSPQPVPVLAPPPMASQNGHSSTINSLSDLCIRADASTAEEHLLLSAYYLTYFEATEQFSLKQINSLMVQSGLAPVNHSVLESTLSKARVQMVPDEMGTASVTEYTLSESGQQQVESLL